MKQTVFSEKVIEEIEIAAPDPHETEKRFRGHRVKPRVSLGELIEDRRAGDVTQQESHARSI